MSVSLSAGGREPAGEGVDVLVTGRDRGERGEEGRVLWQRRLARE